MAHLISDCFYPAWYLRARGVPRTYGKQEAPKAEGKGRMIDLRFGKVKANAQSQRIH